MEGDLGYVDHEPGHPAVPFLQRRQELRHQDQHGHAGVQVGMGVGRKQAVQGPAPESGDDENRPDGATIMLNNNRGDIMWDANFRVWINK